MINPHPPLSGFPIVITTLFIIIELISFFRKKDLHVVSLCLLSSLVVFSLATFISGYFGFDYASSIKHVPEEVVDRHQSFAKIHLILVVALILFYTLKEFYKIKNKVLIATYFFILTIVGLNIYYVGFLGGELVFKHGAGVTLSNQ